MALGSTSLVVQILTLDGFHEAAAGLGAALLGLGVLYAVSRTSHYRLSAVVVAAVPILGGAAVAAMRPTDPAWFAFAGLSVVLAGMFLRPRGVLLVAVSNLLVVGGVGLGGVRGVPVDVGVAAVGFAAALGAAAVLARTHAARLERDRRADLLELNEGLKQQVAERTALLNELEARNAELERFTYTVSHDLKSPLVTIQGFLGHIERDIRNGVADRTVADLRRIGSSVERMQRLLDELLDLSRVGRVASPPSRVPAAELVAQATALLAGEITSSGAVVEVAPDLPVLFGDRQRLLEVLQNLLGNALRFSKHQDRPVVEIGAHPTGAGRAVLFVRDNGIGIEPAYHERVFDLFEKLDAASEGTGIGLALVRRILEAHGGQIWVESNGGETGSTFFFEVPTPPDETAADAGPVPSRSRAL